MQSRLVRASRDTSQWLALIIVAVLMITPLGFGASIVGVTVGLLPTVAKTYFSADHNHFWRDMRAHVSQASGALEEDELAFKYGQPALMVFDRRSFEMARNSSSRELQELYLLANPSFEQSLKSTLSNLLVLLAMAVALRLGVAGLSTKVEPAKLGDYTHRGMVAKFVSVLVVFGLALMSATQFKSSTGSPIPTADLALYYFQQSYWAGLVLLALRYGIDAWLLHHDRDPSHILWDDVVAGVLTTVWLAVGGNNSIAIISALVAASAPKLGIELVDRAGWIRVGDRPSPLSLWTWWTRLTIPKRWLCRLAGWFLGFFLFLTGLEAYRGFSGMWADYLGEPPTLYFARAYKREEKHKIRPEYLHRLESECLDYYGALISAWLGDKPRTERCLNRAEKTGPDPDLRLQTMLLLQKLRPKIVESIYQIVENEKLPPGEQRDKRVATLREQRLESLQERYPYISVGAPPYGE